MPELKTFLALGDSYTIGESVQLWESFPYQAVSLLRNNPDYPFQISAPEIVAKTGWTSDELIEGLKLRNLLENYDFVSLLIGVNNQYRSKPLSRFETDFITLLRLSIALADHQPGNVFVLSIPDWGVTPYAKERDRGMIAISIDEFNECCRAAASAMGCTFIDITTGQRTDGWDLQFVAADELHPSGKEYTKWATKLSDHIIQHQK